MVSDEAAIIGWLMEGDPAIRWQVMRDLLRRPEREVTAERTRVEHEGWGADVLRRQHDDGSWGPHVYAKWNGTFYTMLVLRDLGLPSDHPAARQAARLILDAGYRANDGGLRFNKTWEFSEACLGGMGMAILARFGADDARMPKLADYLAREQMPDGGWNCRRPRGATHASFHTTICVLEGLLEWERRSGDGEVRDLRERAHEFLFTHRLYRSHRTGAVIKDEWTRLHFPPHYHYDVLRGLDYLQAAAAPRDERVSDAIDLLQSRRKPDGCWRLNAGYPGTESLPMERPGEPSRWNTLRALRVLKWWEK